MLNKTEAADAALLSIVIPTFNRCGLLSNLLDDVDTILRNTDEFVQVVICDNASTDATGAVVSSFVARWPKHAELTTRRVNIGMEGNIANAMLEARGKYTWLMSDHQRLIIGNALQMISYLREANFHIAYARIAQWDSVLPQPMCPMQWAELDNRAKGAFFFYAGNIAGLIYKTEMITTAAAWVFRSSIWNYPHLGLVSALQNESMVVEFPALSLLPDGSTFGSIKREYDALIACFANHIDCLEAMFDVAGLRFSRHWFNARFYRRAFLSQIASVLSSHSGSIRIMVRKLAVVSNANRGMIRYTALAACCVLITIPGPARRYLFRRLAAAGHAMYKKAADKAIPRGSLPQTIAQRPPNNCSHLDERDYRTRS